MARATYPAQLVFTEDDRGYRWVGRLLNSRDAVDATNGRPVRHRPYWVITETPSGRYTCVCQGGASHHSRRYGSHESLTAAQLAGVRWAGRRFRIRAVV